MAGGLKYKHSWQVSVAEAVRIQEEIRNRVSQKPIAGPIRLIAGVDAALSPKTRKIIAAVVLIRTDAFDPDAPPASAKNVQVIEEHHAWGDLSFPYIPGLLSFREAPVVLRALKKLRARPDVIILDAQGQAHPRRAGLASHVGVLCGLPCIGCAKSRLIGQARTPGLKKGSATDLLDKRGELIGRVLRTRRAVKCVYVSVGHLINLEQATGIVLALAVRYRLPEPTRLAHILAGKMKFGPPNDLP